MRIRSELLCNISLPISDPFTVLSPTVGKVETTLRGVWSSNRSIVLLTALRSVAPDFDVSTLSVRKDSPESYIAFTGEMELDDSQLSLLGLKDGRRS